MNPFEEYLRRDRAPIVNGQFMPNGLFHHHPEMPPSTASQLLYVNHHNAVPYYNDIPAPVPPLPVSPPSLQPLMINGTKFPIQEPGSGTIVFPCDEDIPDVSMDDVCEMNGLPCDQRNELSFMVSLDDMLCCNNSNQSLSLDGYEVDVREYWRNTKDCDLRVHQHHSTAIGAAPGDCDYRDPTDAGSQSDVTDEQGRCRGVCHHSRKKTKRLKKQLEGIDLTKPATSIEPSNGDDNEEPCLNLNDIDQLEFDELVLYHQKLKQELLLLNTVENQEKNLAPVETERDSPESPPPDNGAQEIQNMINDIRQKIIPIPEVIPLSPISDTEENVREKLKHDFSMISSTSEADEEDKNDEDEDGEKSRDNIMLNENLLREQLIRTMLMKRFTSHQPMPSPEKPEEPKETEPQETKNSEKDIFDKENVPVSRPLVTKPELPPPAIPKVDLSKYRLVIKMHNSDSEEEDCDDCSHQSEDSATETPVPINTAAAANISKLSKSQQREYQKLKRLLELRGEKKKQKENLTKKLKLDEMKLKNTLLSMAKKKKHVFGLNQKYFGMKKKLNKSQVHFQKLKRMLAIAQENVKLETVQLQQMMKQIQEERLSIISDSERIKQYRTLCLETGTKLHGIGYKLPEVTPVEKQVPIGKVDKTFNQAKPNSASMLVNLRTKMQSSLLKISSTSSSSTILLLSHVVNFSLQVFRFSLFFQSNGSAMVPFSDFTEISCELFRDADLDQYPQSGFPAVSDDNENGAYQSVLEQFSSYRFFSQPEMFTQNFRLNAVNPHAVMCQFDLLGACNDVKCPNLHQKDFLYSGQERILDMLAYSPQFSSAINVEELKKNPKLLHEKLQVYLREKGFSPDRPPEELCSMVWKEIQQDSKITTASLLIRLFPKDVIKFEEKSKRAPPEVPFGDHQYNFKMRDDMLDLNLSQVVSLENDPDFYIKNRFFAPEGIPITAQLEASLATDPGNIQMWINLAYHHLGKVRDRCDDLGHLFDAALNVLSRALECNRHNSELYEHYLLLYVNKYDYLPEQRPLPISVPDLCRKILKHCSTYRMWIRFFSLCSSIDLKLKIATEILEKYVQNEIPYSTPEERSVNILEVIFNFINLLLHQNKHQEAVKFFNEIFNNQNGIGTSEQTPSTTVAMLICGKHRVFAWHCYIHLMLFRSLPYHCFQLSKRGCFLPLIDTEPFVFDWKSAITGTAENDVRIIRKIFQRALKNCCTEGTQQCRCNGVDCFALRLNYANLDKAFPAEDAESHPLAELFQKNVEMINDLLIMELFQLNLARDESGSQMLTMFDQFCKLCSQTETEMYIRLKHNYWLAFFQLKMNNFLIAKQFLRSNLEMYFQTDFIQDLMDPTNDSRIVQLYEVLLFDDPSSSGDISTIHQIRSNLKLKDRASSNLVYLYLCYLLYHHILCISPPSSEYNVERHYFKLDCVFSSVINSFSSRNVADQNGTKILWFNYFLLLLEFRYTESHFKIVYETLRHICLNFNGSDPIFINHLVVTVAEFIRPADRLHFLTDVVKLTPDNVNLLLNVIRMALQQSKRETLWNLINYVIYDKRIHLQCIEFWKIAISLSVERNDHLNTHKFFQIAITLMPYDSVLWDMFKKYEKSIHHQEHLDQMKPFYQDTLGLATSAS